MHQPERCGSAEISLVSPSVLPFGVQALNHVTIVTTVLFRRIHTLVRATSKVWQNVLYNHRVQVCVGQN